MRREEAILRELKVWSSVSLFQQSAPETNTLTPSATKPLTTQEKRPVQPVVESISAKKISTPKQVSTATSVPTTGNSDSLTTRVSQCQACALHEGRGHALVGQGKHTAPWFVIAEAPSSEEDLHGQVPFGLSGELLRNLFKAVGVKAFEESYHTFLVKCRPLHNRLPTQEEYESCQPYLQEQLDLVKPKIIILMGRNVAKLFLKVDASLQELRTRELNWSGIPVVVTQDMAALLRQDQEKGRVWRDLMQAKIKLNQYTPHSDNADTAST